MFVFDTINIGIRRKLEAGTAFVCSYFEHGNSLWFLKDSHNISHNPDFRWDGVKIAGLLVWTGKAKDCGENKEKREEHAISFLKDYTAWANGEAYYYRIEDMETGEELDSCGGYLDSE